MSINNPLVVQNLTKIFNTNKKFLAVDNISFFLRQGEFLGFLGPNGAGKTTTIQMLLNLLTPTSGSIFYFGKDFAKNLKVKNYISYASGYMKLPSSLTVKQALLMYGLLYDIKYSVLKERINIFLKNFSLENLKSRNVVTLSSGQTAAVLLARAFLVEPKIVLLDEPTVALDPAVANSVRNFIKEQNKQNGTSVLLTSHNMPEVAQLCDRILVLKEGKIIADNSPEYLASTVYISKVSFVIQDGLEKLISYIETNSFDYDLQEHDIIIEIDEHKIPDLLTFMGNSGIEYTQISIEKPTLEDYFLTLVKRI